MLAKDLGLEGFPNEWPLLRIGDFADVKGGKRLPAGTSLVQFRTSHPYIRIVDFMNGRVNKSNLMYVPEDVFPQIRRYTISANDIYVSIVGTIGLAGIVDRELDGASLTENAAKICNISPQVDQIYLAAFLRSKWGQHQIAAQTVGSTQPKLALFRIEEIRVPVPPIEEQRSIADVIGALDDKIWQNLCTSRELERLARAIFRAWFVDFEPVRAKAAGARSFPSVPQPIFDTLPTRFVDSVIGAVPEGWEVGLLGNQCDINASVVRPGEIAGEIEYIDISSVNIGQLNAIKPILFNDAPSRARRRVRHGDTIWSCVRPNRRSYLFIHTPPSNQIVSTGFAVLSPKAFGPSFLYELTTQSEFVDHLVANADGSAYPAVRPDHFSSATVLVPPVEVLDAFEAITMPSRDLIASADRESVKLGKLRDLLLPNLLSGKVLISGQIDDGEGAPAA